MNLVHGRLTFSVFNAAISMDDSWSDDEEPVKRMPDNDAVPSNSTKPESATLTERALKAQLAASEAKSRQLQDMLNRVLGEQDVSGPSESTSQAPSGESTKSGKPKMDIDTHYFDSYASNGECERWACDGVIRNSGS